MNPLREWFPVVGWMRLWQRGDRMLSVSVAPVPGQQGYKIIALEYPADATPENVLNEHAHKLLGSRKSDAAAKRLAEQYAKKWIGEAVAVERCNCGEISAVAS